MSEDYTYDTEPTRDHPMQVAGLKRDNATLAARVQELMREVSELRQRQTAQAERSTLRIVDVALDAERQTLRVAELERENAELRLKLDAVPVDAIKTVCDIAEMDAGEDVTRDVRDWLFERYGEV